MKGVLGALFAMLVASVPLASIGASANRPATLHELAEEARLSTGPSQKSEVLEKLESYRRLNPADEEIHRMLGEQLSAMSRLVEAREHLDTYHRRQGLHARTNLLRCQIHAFAPREGLSHPCEGLDLFFRGDSSEGWLTYALYRHSLDDLDAAREAYFKALAWSDDPDLVLARLSELTTAADLQGSRMLEKGSPVWATLESVRHSPEFLSFRDRALAFRSDYLAVLRLAQEEDSWREAFTLFESLKALLPSLGLTPADLYPLVSTLTHYAPRWAYPSPGERLSWVRSHAQEVVGQTAPHFEAYLLLNFDLARAYIREGDRKQAAGYLNTVLRMLALSGAPVHDSTKDIAGSIPHILFDLLLSDFALEYAQTVYQKNREYYGDHHPELLRPLLVLASMHLKRGEASRAEPLLVQARALEVTYGAGLQLEDSFVLAAQYGALLASLGQTEQALNEAQRLVRDTQANLTSIALRHRGCLYVQLDLPGEGLRDLEEALTLDPELLEADEYLLDCLALAYGKANQPEVEVVLRKRIVTELQSKRQQMAFLPIAVDPQITRTVSYQYEKLADALVGLGRILEAQDVLQMLKERELHDTIERSGAGPDPRKTQLALTGVEQAAFERYYQLRDQQAALIRERQELQAQQRNGSLSPAQARRLSDILKQHIPLAAQAMQRFFASLQAELAQQSARPGGNVDILNSQRRLRNAVISFSRADPQAGVVGIQYLHSGKRLSIILTFAEGPPLARQIELEGRDLNKAVFAALNLLRTPPGRSSDEIAKATAQAKEALRALHLILMAPVEADLRAARAKTLMVSATGVMRYVPFPALFDGQRYLVEDYQVSWLNEASDVHLGPGPGQWNVVGFGLSETVKGLPALAAVPQELKAVVSATGGQYHLNRDFTRERLLSALQGAANVLHLASHFVYERAQPHQSHLFLGDKSQLSLQDITALDMRFDNFDLVAFSACETALADGVDANGLEVESLGAKAQLQGARSVLATLWKVNDESTAFLMQSFYQARAGTGGSKAAAIRQAQLSMLQGRSPAKERWSHPYHWASVLLMGNWR